MIADIGLLGMPNAGKSSLLRALSRAHPAVAPYPFTSLTPTLGTLPASPADEPLVLVDIPGVIDGAAAGRGLGNQFLRHLARVRVIAYVVSLIPLDGIDAVSQLELLRRELHAYDPTLLRRVVLIIATKQDAAPLPPPSPLPPLSPPSSSPPLPLIPCSAIRGDGIPQLIATLYRTYHETAQQ